MRILLTVAILTMPSGLLYGQEIPAKNDPVKHPTLINKTFVDKINGRSIDFYMNHKSIDLSAKLFYKGKFALNDDQETFSFLDSVITKNEETRPFYLFIYHQAMKVTDGALGEYMASVCRRYFEMFPCEFVVNLDDNVFAVDVEKWTGFIAFDIYDRRTFDSIVAAIDKKVNTNCLAKKSEWGKVKLKIMNKLVEK